jgi:hypothetical protein
VNSGKSCPKKNELEDYLLPCLSKWIFGIDCPGCGLQRALLHLCYGEFGAAWKQYPPVFTTLLFAISAFVYLLNKKAWQGKMLVIFAIVNMLFVVISYYFRVLIKL